ncbi:MAG: hypothetical protein WCL23_02455 [Candidatus Moraniibacteriota bacterium]
MSTPLSKERKGEIAYVLIGLKLKREGLRLTPSFKREMGDIAKEVDIPFEELLQFTEEITRKLVDEIFTKPKFKIVKRT